MNKYLLVCLAKNEHNYICEFINHYKSLGFTNILLLDNSDEQYNMYNIVYNYINSGFLIYVKDYGTKYNQIEKYTNIYNKYSNNYDWIAFFDADEFLILPNHFNIDKYCSQDIFKNVDGIKICWQIYDDNDILLPKSFNLMNTYTRLSKNTSLNTTCKTIYKTHKYKTYKYVGAHCIYKPYLNIVDCNGNTAKNINRFIGNIPIIDNAYIKHFKTKSIYEFITNRLEKWKNSQYGNNPNYKETINDFFNYNEFTEEKLSLAKKLLNI